MLKKLLKYDLRAMFRTWWLAAAVTVMMSILGGFAKRTLTMRQYLPSIVTTCANLLTFFAYFAIAGLLLVSLILIFIRYYRNFFTDEGYLTFTLPTRRETLLNSKVLSGFVLMGASFGICLAELCLISSIATAGQTNMPTFSADVEEFFRDGWYGLKLYLPIYILEVLVIGLSILALSVLFLYCCITFASMIVKKGKLIAAIGIYYGASNLFTGLFQLLFIFMLSGTFSLLSDPLSDETSMMVVALFLLAIILLLNAIGALMYTLTYRMLVRRLNLS